MKSLLFIICLTGTLCFIGCSGQKRQNNISQPIAVHPTAPVAPDTTAQMLPAPDTTRIATADTVQYHITHTAADSVWIKELLRIPLPEQIEQRVQINVYMKYKTPVNGYIVTARWMPFDAQSETGYIVLNFRHPKSGRNFQYINTEKYNNYNTDQITFAKDFTGHHNGDLHLLDYPAPTQSADDSYPTDATHPLGYRTPFQFYDIDFDGTNEFLLSDWGRYRGGNQYKAYEIGPHGLKEIDYLPLNQLMNDTEIDRKKRIITLHSQDGAYDACTLYFSKARKKATAHPAQLPELPTWSGRSILKEYAQSTHHPFRLDSIHAHHNDSLYIYHIQ